MNRRAFLAMPTAPPQGGPPIPPPPLPTPPIALPKPKAAKATPTYTVAPLNIEAGLEAYATPLDRHCAAHLLRRTCFGAAPDRVQDLIGQPASEAVQALMDEALARPLPEVPIWADAPPPPRGADPTEFEEYVQGNVYWMLTYRNEVLQETFEGGLREKLALFWSNHFVTSTQSYALAPFAYRYMTLLRTHALGNFKQFVYDIGLNPAMLVYLNGNTNQKDAPNENYAREMLELFTMGQFDRFGNENYTQTDIQEIARALTGWIVDYFALQVRFIPFLFDNTTKTFMGRAGAFSYNEVVDIVFEERAASIAYFICSKLYEEFVYAAPDEAIVAELAELFIANDFEIAPVVQTLLGSAHFFDQQVIGARIKSPVEMITGMMIEAHHPPQQEIYEFYQRISLFMGQYVLSPPNVAGWPGHHAWLSTTTLPIRWLTSDTLLYGVEGMDAIELTALATTLHDASDPFISLYLPLKMAEHFFAVPIEALDISNIEDDFAGDLVNNPIPNDVLTAPPHVLSLTKIFLSNLPWYEWAISSNNVEGRLRRFVSYLLQFPEYNLT